jgi:hypothetical protein
VLPFDYDRVRALITETSMQLGGSEVVTNLTCTTIAWGLLMQAMPVTFRLWKSTAGNGSVPALELVRGVGGTYVQYYEEWNQKNSKGIRGAKGGDLVTISGAGFNSDARDYYCLFTATTPVVRNGRVVYYSAKSEVVRPSTLTELSCTTPRWPTIADTAVMTVQRASSGEVVAKVPGTGDYFSFFACWTTMSPHSGTALGGDLVTFNAYGLDTAGFFYAQFVDATDASVVINSDDYPGNTPDSYGLQLNGSAST